VSDASRPARPSSRPPQYCPSVARALRELAQMPLAEACLSGSCDICLAQRTALCHTDRPGVAAHPARRAGQ